MSDSSFSQMLERVGDQPTDLFVARLRTDLLHEFHVVGTAPLPDDGTGYEAEIGYASSETLAEYAAAEVVRPTPYRSLAGQQTDARGTRRWGLAAAAVAAVVAGASAIVIHQQNSSSSIRSTVSAGRSARHLSTDIVTPGGTTIHFDGTLDLAQAVESNEQSTLAEHDVLLLPKIDGTFTNAGTNPTPVLSAYVQIFLRGDVGACVKNNEGCETGVVRGARDPAGSARILQRGESIVVTDAGSSSRISVLAADVPVVIDQVRQGRLVVGFAVVVAGKSANDVASRIFDRHGNLVASCASLPDRCLDAARSELGVDAAPAPTTNPPATGDNGTSSGAGSALAVISPVPSGGLKPGRYTSAIFRIPLQLTVTGAWQGATESYNGLVLRRVTSGGGRVALQFMLGLTSDSSSVAAPADVLAALCPGSVRFDPPHDARLLGYPAIETDGVTTEECRVATDTVISIAANSTVRVIAADVGNGRLLVGIAFAATDQWRGYDREVAAMFASLTAR